MTHESRCGMALDDALTADDVAAMLRVSRNTVYNLVKRDQLASYHVGRKMRFTRADVENYIARTTQGAEATAATVPAPRATAASAPSRTVRDVASDVYVISGNDIIGDMLANYLGGMGHAVERRYEDSYAALTSLYLGRAGAALTHIVDTDGTGYTGQAACSLAPASPLRLVRLAERQQGLIVARGNPKGIFGWKDLLRPDVRLINRELGSGSRILLDTRLSGIAREAGTGLADLTGRIDGYATCAPSALAMASYVERGAADVGVGAERVARQVEGVDFVPLQRECLDIALSLAPAAAAISNAVTSLLRVRAFREEAAAVTGYDVGQMGRVLLER